MMSALPLLVASTLALDLAAVAPTPVPSSELRVEALELDGFVSGRLTNTSARPLSLVVGWACSRETPLTAYFDGVEGEKPKRIETIESPATEPCGLGERYIVLEPGKTTMIPGRNVRTDSLRNQSVRLAYEVTPAVAAKLKYPPHAHAFRGVAWSRWTTNGASLVLSVRVDGDELVVDHALAPPAARMGFLAGWKGACPSSQTALLVDDAPVLDWPTTPAACAGPSAPDWRMLSVGERWSVRGPIPAALRGRSVHARYRVTNVEISNATRIQPARPEPFFWGGRVETQTPVAVPR